MTHWEGSAGCCVDREGRVLMVLQGKPDDEWRWSVPSRGREPGETFEVCCVREVWEETGYRVRVVQELFRKRGHSCGFEVDVHYYLVDVVGGGMKIQDPDGLTHDIAWQHPREMATLPLAFPEDRDFLIRLARWGRAVGEGESGMEYEGFGWFDK